MKRAFHWSALIVLLGALSLAGCDLGGGGGSSPSASASPTVGSTTTAVAHLTHQPTGTADLSWDPGSKTLTVKIALTGLAPNSTHPAHIHSGTCATGGTAIYPFNPDLAADAKGNVTTTQTFQNVTGGIPSNGWFINVHNAPGGDIYEKMDIACADIHNPDPDTSVAESVHVDFARGYGPSQNSSGETTLAIRNGNQLLVTITMTGLEPTSVHKAHIHSGSCQSQGGVVYPLTDVTADTAGNATSTTTIANVSSIPTSGWYVNVHRGVNLASPIDFDPIACGNVTAA